MRPPEAIFGIHSSALNAAVELLILFLIVIWAALIYWTYADARRRIADPMLVGCATAAAFFPYVGTIVYMIVRPPEFLDDVRERELEMQAAEARLAALGYQLCPHCEGQVEKEFLRCPHCIRRLKDPCAACGRPLDPRWRICPFCETEVGSAPAARRVVRRRSEQLAGPTGPLAGTPPQSGQTPRRGVRAPLEPARPATTGPARDRGSDPSRVGAGSPAEGSPDSPGQGASRGPARESGVGASRGPARESGAGAPRGPARESGAGAPRGPSEAPATSPRQRPADADSFRPLDANGAARTGRLADPTA